MRYFLGCCNGIPNGILVAQRGQRTNDDDENCSKQNAKLRRRFQATERIWDRFSEPLLTDHNQYQKQMGLRIHLKFLSVAKSACHSWAASGKA